MNRIQMLVCWVLLMAVSLGAKGQDMHFSQFFEAPLQRNPSLAGIFQGDIRIQSVFRTQWASVTVPYKTGSLAIDYKQPVGGGDDFLTMGMQVLYDRAGTAALTTTSVMPAINYHKAIGGYKNKYLALGFMGGWVQRRFDRSKITTNNHFDGNGYNPSLGDGETFVNSSFSYLDGSVGMSFNSSIAEKSSDNYFIGVAYHHFNRPKNSFYKNPDVELQAKIVVSTGVRFTLNETSYFTIQGDYTKQGPSSQTIAGALYSYKLGEDIENPQYTIHFGGFLRVKDAFIPVVKLDCRPFSFAFSYDATVSQLKTASQGRGALEFSLTYAGFLDRDNSSRNAVLCPKF